MVLLVIMAIMVSMEKNSEWASLQGCVFHTELLFQTVFRCFLAEAACESRISLVCVPQRFTFFRFYISGAVYTIQHATLPENLKPCILQPKILRPKPLHPFP